MNIRKIQTFLRLLVVGLLIWPFPLAYASEVTETETFDGTNGAQVTDLGIPSGNYAVDDGDNVSIRNDQNCCGVGGQYFFSLLDNQTEQNANTTGFTFTLPSDHDIKEVGFRTAGVNTAYTIQYNYSDSTNETVNYNGQAGSQYEDITKSITGKYITSFVITVSDWSGIDTIYWKYDSTPVLNTPQNLTGTVNYENGTVLVDWDAPASSNTSVERYAIGFGIADDSSTPYGIATGNVGDSTALNTEYTFTASYLKSVFTDAHGLFNVKIRADNDTSSVYSSYTSTLGVTIVNKPPKPTNLAVSESSGTYRLSWTAPTGGFVDASSYRVYMKVGDNDYVMINAAITETYFDIQHTNLTETTAFLYYISSCGSENDCNVDSTNTVGYTYTYSAPALGPPMNPVVSNVYNSGVLVDWDEANSGNTDAETYELYYRISGTSENTVVTGITDTQYTIPYSEITDNTYVFSIRAINTTESLTSGYSIEPTLGVVNQKVIDDIAAQVAYEQQVAYEAEVAATNAEMEANAAETGVLETNSEREYREATEVIVIVLDDGSEGNYTQNDVNDGTVERDNQRAANEAEYGCYVTDEAIERGDCGNIEIYEEERDTNGEFPNDDVLVLEVATDVEDEEYYDDIEWIEEEVVYEVYDEDEGWVEVSEEEFEEILEYEAERDAKELEILDTYDDEYLEDLNLYIPEEEFEGLTDEEILILEEELQRDFEEFIETVLAVEQYLEELEEYEQEVILIEIVEFEDVVIVFEEEFPEEFPEDELPPVIIIEDFPDEGPIERPYEDEVFVEELNEEELEILTEEEYEEYKEERKEVIETYVEELEEEILEEVLPETVTVEEFEEIKEKDIEELTEEEVEIVVEVAAEVIEEVVDIEKLEEVIVAEEIIVLEEEELEELSEEELEAYEEEIEEVITEYVQELATEELVVVVEQVAEVGVKNLASADEQTVKVIQAVVTEVVNVETVEELSEEEVEVVGELLGFTEEEAAEDVQIIAEQASKDENTATAVEEFVERAIVSADVENFTLADVVTEVQIEAFLENPVQEIFDVNLGELDISTIGDDMTSDQREKAQEVVIPVIIASQIIAQAGALMRRF